MTDSELDSLSRDVFRVGLAAIVLNALVFGGIAGYKLYSEQTSSQKIRVLESEYRLKSTYLGKDIQNYDPSTLNPNRDYGFPLQ